MAAAEELQAHHVIPADLLLIFVVVLDLAVTVACLGGLSKRAVLFDTFVFIDCFCFTVALVAPSVSILLLIPTVNGIR